MPIREKYFPGTAVSRYLAPGEHSWDEGVYQSSKPVLDSELNLSQEINRVIRNLTQEREITSGWLRGPSPQEYHDSGLSSDFATGTASANQFVLRKRTALVAGLPVVVEYTGTPVAGFNLIELDASPVYGGAPPDVKRTDFVFLEVWRCVVSSSPRASATVEVITNASVTAGDLITINGVPLTASAVPRVPGADDFEIGGSEAATAADIVAAINDPANSFTGICTATVDPLNAALVNLRAADPFAGTAGNAITLSLTLAVGGSITVNGGAGPTLFSGGSDTPNKPTQATIYRHGNVDADSTVNLTDDIEDPLVNTETTKRVQIQYRIRTTGQTEAVNFKTENGFDNSNVEAFGATGAAVAGYPFVPADNSTVNGSSDATAYQTVDAGLWIAGDGSSTAATALGTVDGYVYAIPICFVFRRNDAYDGGAGAGFDPITNTNGALPQVHPGFANPTIGAIPANTSDRPDGRFHDLIERSDILDLRRQVVPGGIDLKAELERQMTLLLDGTLSTWAIDAADKNTLGSGSGDVGTKFLVCNEVGRSGAKGGVSPSSGDTPRGDSIADFDHIRRRFADWPVVERRIFPILPTDYEGDPSYPGKYVTKVTGLHTTWEEGDVLNIDLDSLDCTGLGDWAHAPSGVPFGGGAVSNLWPPGTTISDVLRVIHDDGNFAGAIAKDVEMDQVRGLGTNHVQIRLGRNTRLANGGVSGAGTYELVSVPTGAASPRRIWIELEIAYPIGNGTTDTPDEEVVPAPTVYADGPLIENDTAERPDDWEEVLDPLFREGQREVTIEYAANDGSVPGGGSGTPVSDTFVSDTPLQIRLPRRIFGSGTTVTTVTDVSSGPPSPVSVDTTATEYGSSSRILAVQGGTPLAGAQSLVNVDYFPQDPLPNWGAVGYQVSVYYRSNAPQTVGVQAGAPATWPLPATLEVRPVVMSRDLWTGTVGSGSSELGFPYPNPLDQIAVNGDLSPATFPAEWILQATARISVGDFDAATGLLSLHQMSPVDGNQDFSFEDKDVDSEFRGHYKMSDVTAYRPTAMAQPLSGPATHKVFFPFLAQATADNVFFRKGEVLLVVVSRFAALDGDNVVRFTDTDNETCAAVYRTRGLLLLASE
jgi:hypothetical protein